MKSKNVTEIIKKFSLYSIVLYYHKENEFDSASAFICFISDDLKHDVAFVCKLLKVHLSISVISLQKFFLK